jgi:hypothetical protein
VVSIIKQFQGDGELDMIAPQGTVFGPDTDASRVFPHIVRKYGLGVTQSVSEVFRHNVLQMEDTFHQLFPNGFSGEVQGLSSVMNWLFVLEQCFGLDGMLFMSMYWFENFPH